MPEIMQKHKVKEAKGEEKFTGKGRKKWSNAEEEKRR